MSRFRNVSRRSACHIMLWFRQRICSQCAVSWRSCAGSDGDPSAGGQIPVVGVNLGQWYGLGFRLTSLQVCSKPFHWVLTIKNEFRWHWNATVSGKTWTITGCAPFIHTVMAVGGWSWTLWKPVLSWTYSTSATLLLSPHQETNQLLIEALLYKMDGKTQKLSVFTVPHLNNTRQPLYINIYWNILIVNLR